MGMPQVPERKNLPNIDDVIVQILESVALEELAMAHIMNAEGEKMQALIKKIQCGEICATTLCKSFKETNNMIDSLIMKEWIMVSKIRHTLEIYTKIEDESSCYCKNSNKCKP